MLHHPVSLAVAPPPFFPSAILVPSSPSPLPPPPLSPTLQVRALAALNHKNLVRLFGFCLHMDVVTGKQEQILVYEFVKNGDLSKIVRTGRRECGWGTGRLLLCTALWRSSWYQAVLSPRCLCTACSQ